MFGRPVLAPSPLCCPGSLVPPPPCRAWVWGRCSGLLSGSNPNSKRASAPPPRMSSAACAESRLEAGTASRSGRSRRPGRGGGPRPWARPGPSSKARSPMWRLARSPRSAMTRSGMPAGGHQREQTSGDAGDGSPSGTPPRSALSRRWWKRARIRRATPLSCSWQCGGSATGRSISAVIRSPTVERRPNGALGMRTRRPAFR